MNKINFTYYVNFIDSYDNFDQSKINKKFNKENMLMHEYNAYKIFLKSDLTDKESFAYIKKNYFLNLSEKKNVVLLLKKVQNIFILMRDLQMILKIIKRVFFHFVDMGYEIHIYGDELKQLPKWFNDIEKNIFT